MDIQPFRAGKRVQQGVFSLARDLTKAYLGQPDTTVPAHVLFPQLLKIVDRFVHNHVRVPPSSARVDVFMAPYFGWAVEILVQQIQPDTSLGEAPELPRCDPLNPECTTAAVDYWTSKDVRETTKSHVNYVVADTAKWEQQAAFYIDRNRHVTSFVKNAGLGFAVPYLHNGQGHDFIPDFIVRLATDPVTHLILETKGFDPLAEVKQAAAERWVNAVNADGRWGRWAFRMARSVADVSYLIDEAIQAAGAVPSMSEA